MSFPTNIISAEEVECPPCKELCSTTLNCGHNCQHKCHCSVKTTIRLDKSKLAGPWEAKEDGKIIFVAQPCPPCNVELSLVCFGAHEVRLFLLVAIDGG